MSDPWILIGIILGGWCINGAILILRRADGYNFKVDLSLESILLIVGTIIPYGLLILITIVILILLIFFLGLYIVIHISEVIYDCFYAKTQKEARETR